MDSLALISETFAPLDGRRLLDIGCGAGHLARALAARGAAVTGIDTSDAAIASARTAAPEARFEVAAAEALRFADGTFGGAVFLNSLHHVPGKLMGAALAEAARVTASGELVVVIEPLAEGSFFAAFRAIEDETAVRDEAQAAVAEAVARGILVPVRSLTYGRREAFADFGQFVGRATAAEPARLAVIERERARIEAGFAEAASRDPEGRYVLDQPLKADILRVPVR